METKQNTITVHGKELKLPQDERSFAVFTEFENQQLGFTPIEVKLASAYVMLKYANPEKFTMPLDEFMMDFFEDPDTLNAFDRWADERRYRISAMQN